MRAIFVASLLLTATAALAQTPAVVVEATSTSAGSPSAPATKGSCYRLYLPDGPQKNPSLSPLMGEACWVPVRDGVTYFNVILENATGNQFQVIIEPRSTAPQILRTLLGPGSESANAEMAKLIAPGSLNPVLYPLASSGLPTHRRLHLDETLDIPVPDAASDVHITFRWQPPKTAWSIDLGTEFALVNAPPPLSGAARDWTAPEPELKFEKAKIVFPDPAKENPKHVQYALAGSGSRDDLRWVYLTGLGRFVFSLTPHPELGFQLAGEIQRDTLRVALGRVALSDLRFDITSSIPLLESSEAFRLYVRAEPSYPAPTTMRLPVIGWTGLEELQPLNAR